MKNRLAGIVLLFCLVAPFVVTYTWLQVKKSSVKRSLKWEMIAGLDKQELILIPLTKVQALTELHWEHSKEFEYKNQLYDVVDKVFKGDSIYYWCWLDHEETKLNKQLRTLVARALGKDSQHQSNKKNLLDFYKQLFYQDAAIPALSRYRLMQQHHTTYAWPHLNYFYIPLTPPPETLF